MPELKSDSPPIVIIAGGPSLTLSQVRIVGMARAQNKCSVIAVNDAIYPCWFADVCYAGDKRWWQRHEGLAEYSGLKYAIQETGLEDILTLENGGRDYLKYDPDTIGSWSNSGAQAIHLASRVGAKKIILLGFDYSGSKETNDGTRDHWFGRHQGELDINSNVDELRRLLRVLTANLVSHGVSIVNCSPNSTIDWLPSSRIEEVFADV